MALHWPVILLAPVPGRPMFPVIRARLMIAWAVRVASCPWFTPIVHQNDTRWPWWMSRARRRMLLRRETRVWAARSMVKSAT